MEINKKFLGSKVYIKILGREVLICEENKLTLLQHNLKHLFVFNKTVKAEEPIKTIKPKKQIKKKQSDNSRPTDSEYGEHRINSDVNNS